jgi:CRP-like cAMP-binding protein
MSANPRQFGLFRNAPNATSYAPNSTIFTEGESGAQMFAIRRGKVAVRVRGQTVDTLGEGEVFGEMALLDQAVRTATVVTLEETELVAIDKAQFYLLVRQNPHFALQLMQLLSERLRQTHALYGSSGSS